MKSIRLWFFLYLPIILIFTSFFSITYLAETGSLKNRFLRKHFFSSFRVIEGLYTNLKFRIRGPQKPKNKIIVVEIDSASLETLGRWPWHRHYLAFLIDKVFQAGAKVVGLDIVFSEPDPRVPEQMRQALIQKNLPTLADHFETDPVLAQTIAKHREHLVLGWTTESACQPAYFPFEKCPVTHPEAIASHPPLMPRFTISKLNLPPHFQPQKTPLMSVVTFISNLPIFQKPALHSGTFNIFPDPDSYIRRTILFLLANKRAYPSIALEMARIGKNETLALDVNQQELVKSLRFEKSNTSIPVTPLGAMEINFRGPSYTFPYVSALELLKDNRTVHIGLNREIAIDKKSLFKNAYVLIGLSAIGVHDMRAFPFDANTPGVEGHATILDNLLSLDPLLSTYHHYGWLLVFLLMTLGAFLFTVIIQKMGSITSVFLFIISLLAFALIDIYVLFQHQINWNFSFFYLEMSALFIATVSAKYILEEKTKKFVKNAFSKYVSPTVVDDIIKNPAQLKIGGEKRELSILFSDIRNFTALSEKMDPKYLSKFLNQYLGSMSDIIIAHEGTVDKYIGDAIMAFWGAPLAQKDHADKAARAACAMLKALNENRSYFLETYGVEVRVGVGLNSGTVSVGNMGSDRIFSYTVIGDHVNLASRLEGLTKTYGITAITTGFTMQAIEQATRPLPPHRTLDLVKVKGKKEAVEIIQLLDNPLPQKTILFFQEGLDHYQHQRWEEAISSFEKANEICLAQTKSMDRPSLLFIERCLKFREAPPESSWDGSWIMTSK